MSKYNDFMSHIRVDDDMHRRVMDAVSKAISENASSGAEIKPLNSSKQASVQPVRPVRRRKAVPLIKALSIAAAAILVTGGALFICSRFLTVSEAPQANYGVREEADEIKDTGMGANKTFLGTKPKAKSFFGDKTKDVDSGAKGASGAAGIDDDRAEGMTEDTTAAEEGTSGTDIKNVVPFNVKTIGAKRLNDGQITGIVYNGENGETMILFTSKEGADICKAYYPEFNCVPAVHRTEGGVEFKGIDISVGNNEKVSESGPYDAVTWTKNGTSYMVVFNTKTDIKAFAAIIDKI